MQHGFYLWPRRFRHVGLIIALLASLFWFQQKNSFSEEIENQQVFPEDTCRVIEREILILDIARDSNSLLQWYLGWDTREETLESYSSTLRRLPYQIDESYSLQEEIEQRLAGNWHNSPDRSFLIHIFIANTFVLFCALSFIFYLFYFYFKPSNTISTKPPLPWFSVGWVLMVFFLAEIVTAIVTEGIYDLFYKHGIFSYPLFIIADGVSRGMVPFLVFAVSFIKWKHFKKKMFPDFKIHWKLVFRALGVTYLTIYLLSYILPSSDKLANLEPAEPTLDYMVYIFFSSVIFAPLFEEITFRGFLFQGLRHKLGFFTAATLSSVLFASIHLQYDWVAMIYVGIGGFAGCWITQRTGSLASGIVSHALHNFSYFITYYLIYQYPL